MQSLHRFFSFLDSWNSYFPIGAYLEQTPTGINAAGAVVGTGIADYIHGIAGSWLSLPGALSTDAPTTVGIYYPTSYSTWVDGINDSGEVIGSYSNASDTGTFGFTYSGGSNGTYSPLEIPGVTDPIPLAINDAGDIAGSDGNSNKYFIYSGGTLTWINYAPIAINASGEVTGNYSNVGVAYDNGIYSTIDVPDFGINSSYRY